jgi:hypothetical protein
MNRQLQPEENMMNRVTMRTDIIVSPNMLQMVEPDSYNGEPTDDEFTYALANLKDSIDHKIKKLVLKHQPTQTEEDPKPLIDFLLRSNKLSSGDLVALKQKVASIRAKEKQENTQIVRENMSRISEAIQQENNEVLNSTSMDAVVNTMVSNYSPTRLHKLFKHSSSKDIADAINQAYEADMQDEGSKDYRLQNSGFIMN